jgi:hypothetical protein
MTTLQKTLITTALAAAIGVAGYEAQQASRLRAEISNIRRQQALRPEPPKDAAVASLQENIGALQARNGELLRTLAQANADKAGLQTDREQARHSAVLFKELVEQANSKEVNPTNEYPTARHVWVGWGRFCRLAAQCKQLNGDDSELAPDEKSALEAAKINAVEELPKLVKAMDQLDKQPPAGTDSDAEKGADMAACLLYGALNLDEQQFGQVYAVIDKYQLQAQQQGLHDMPVSESTEAVKQMMEQARVDMQSFLTPDQAVILADVFTHIKLAPNPDGTHNLSFGFNL